MGTLLKKKWDAKTKTNLTPSIHPDSNPTQTLDQGANSNEKNEIEYIRPVFSDNVCINSSDS